jgi:peptide/nickel transport system ATP-binding protein
MTETAVRVEGLRVVTIDGRRCLVDDGCLDLAAGEVLGVVGESGSGKTTLGLALLNHCRRGLRIDGGTVRIDGRNLCAESADSLRQARGRVVCYVPQDPASALNPALRIRTQIRECLPAERRDPAVLLELLAAVNLPVGRGFLDNFPHQLSGGQLQRVAIAMAFANRPRLVVMDEPTTGLDVTTQAHVLETIRELCKKHGVAAIYVSHDIAVVAAISQRVAVVYAGRVVEIGPTARVLKAPAHPYTRALMRAVPDIDDGAPVRGIPGQAPEAGAESSRCSFAPRCLLATAACRLQLPASVEIEPEHEVRCLRAHDREPLELARSLPPPPPPAGAAPLLVVDGLRAFYAAREVLHGVRFRVAAGECVALVGESGSGKTTLARCIAGLHARVHGSMAFKDEPLPLEARRRGASARRLIQYISQNPYGSFNPRRSVGASLAMALSQFERLTASEQRDRVQYVLEQVSLPAATAGRYPRDLSGGQRQRAAIARALITDPELLVCDEITSALDVSVQAVITELLCRLQRERGLAMLFVTHNLAVVRGITQRICVVQDGNLVEEGATEEVMRQPRAAETQRLLRDAPRFAAREQEMSPCP